MKKNDNTGDKKPIPLFKDAKSEEQLSRDELRRKRKQKLLKKRRIKKAFMTLFLFAVLVGIGAALSFTVFFKTETINIEGNTVYSAEKIEEYCGVKKGDNLLRADLEKIGETLKKELPYIGSVSVKKKLPATLTLKITETREAAAVASGGEYILLDPEGKVLSLKSSVLKENVALINGITLDSPETGSVITSSETSKCDALKTVLRAMEKSGITGISAIDISNPDDIVLKYDFRISLKLGSASNAEKKLERAKAVLEKEDKINNKSVGTLDLRSEPYSYFRPGSETSEPVSESETAEDVSNIAETARNTEAAATESAE